jgi:hypothetical protein
MTLNNYIELTHRINTRIDLTTTIMANNLNYANCPRTRKTQNTAIYPSPRNNKLLSKKSSYQPTKSISHNKNLDTSKRELQ